MYSTNVCACTQLQGMIKIMVNIYFLRIYSKTHIAMNPALNILTIPATFWSSSASSLSWVSLGALQWLTLLRGDSKCLPFMIILIFRKSQKLHRTKSKTFIRLPFCWMHWAPAFIVLFNYILLRHKTRLSKLFQNVMIW